MSKTVITLLSIITFGFAAAAVRAAVVPDFATNNYQNHELSRTEKKCLDDGYKITYANCSNQTAPADRCPDHYSYYRSCSQEQWCRNNNYRFLAADCKLPLYPVKMCDNGFPLYRVCQENVIKACEDSGFVSKDECKLTEKRCPYSKDYGICCDSCPNFAYQLDQIPAGYIPDGEACTTCDDIVKTNVKPAPCDGFQECRYGPMSTQTPSCLQGQKRLFSACKTAEMLCKEKGFVNTTCAETEDARDCPENPVYKSCTTNCFKLAQSLYSESDIIPADTQNPVLDLTKNDLRSLVGMEHSDCRKQSRPIIEITINRKNMEQYQNLFERNLHNVIIKLNYEEPLTLKANGKFDNVKIIFSGELPACPLESQMTTVSKTVSFSGAPQICLNFNVLPNSKLLTEGSIRGNVDLGKDSALGVKGDLIGYLKSGNYSEVFIKGRLLYRDELNSSLDDESIVFGCDSKNKIVGGIFADTASVIFKPRSKTDTMKIELKSTSDNLKLPNTLSSIHLHKYSKLFSTYGNEESTVVFPLVENDTPNNCEDKYYVHLGSAVETAKQSIAVEPTNLLEGKWECRKLGYKQQLCN